MMMDRTKKGDVLSSFKGRGACKRGHRLNDLWRKAMAAERIKG